MKEQKFIIWAWSLPSIFRVSSMISWLKSRLGHVFSSKNMYKNWKIPNDYYRIFDDGMYHANVFYWLISTRFVAAVHFQFVQKKGPIKDTN